MSELEHSLKRIKIGLVCLFLAGISSAHALEVSSPAVLKPSPEQVEAAHLTAEFLTRFHYRPIVLDDALSVRIMNRFIDSLDPDRLIFLQADVDKFLTGSKEIDDAIERQDLTIPFTIFNTYQMRIIERMTFARSLLKQGFDFSKQEDFAIVRDKAPGRDRLRKAMTCGASASRTIGCA